MTDPCLDILVNHLWSISYGVFEFDKCTGKPINAFAKHHLNEEMSINNFKILGIIVLITTFVYSNSLQYHYTAFASSQNSTTTSSNMSYSIITDNDGLDKSINRYEYRQYESNY